MEPKDTVSTTNFKGYSNTKCEFFPCHKPHAEFNCLFCYCPLVYRSEEHTSELQSH